MKIVETSQMRAVEAAAVADGTTEFTLMKRAGRAAAELVSSWMRRYGLSRIVFLCGGGNNAGDALVAATLLHVRYPVGIWLYRPLDSLHGAAAQAASLLPDELRSAATGDFEALGIGPGDLLVDGMLGIGLAGEVRQPLAEVIAKVNASRLPVIALDVPSGMDSDTGEGRCPGGEALRADCTITFGLPKYGLFTSCGTVFSGILRVADIGLSEYAADSACDAYTELEAWRDLPRFAADIHKDRRGRMLIMAGSRRYPGAAALATCAALRGGAGVVYSLVPSGAKISLPHAAIPVEVAAAGQGGFAAVPEWREYRKAAALVAGPGWGEDVPVAVLEKVLDFPGKLLLDADALNLLARHPELWKRRDDVVLTPHPGEAERLRLAFGIPASGSRGEAAAALAARLGAVVVLKGARTATACPTGETVLNTSGSSDLAAAGSGDVLSGLIGALLANGMAVASAAKLGVFIHGRAGENCGRGCIADDLPAAISKVMTDLEKGRIFLKNRAKKPVFAKKNDFF